MLTFLLTYVDGSSFTVQVLGTSHLTDLATDYTDLGCGLAVESAEILSYRPIT